MIKLKDLVATFSATYEMHLYDEKDNEKLFSCQTDSKALEHYGNWIVRDISFVPSIFGCSYGGVKVYIREMEK